MSRTGASTTRAPYSPRNSRRRQGMKLGRSQCDGRELVLCILPCKQ
jgi:hypothetical protein